MPWVDPRCYFRYCSLLNALLFTSKLNSDLLAQTAFAVDDQIQRPFQSSAFGETVFAAGHGKPRDVPLFHAIGLSRVTGFLVTAVSLVIARPFNLHPLFDNAYVTRENKSTNCADERFLRLRWCLRVPV